MTELDDRLRDHYRGMQLDNEAIRRISQSSPAEPVLNMSKTFHRWPGAGWAVVAVLVLSLTVAIHQYGTHTERTTRTLNEAAMNHSTRLQLEFEADSIDDIDVHMAQLPFEVALPSQFSEQFALLGARYCTINGELAAHVKFVDKITDKQVSLFMTRAVDGLRTIDETRDRIDGVNVRLWNESGLFYAMASRSPLI